MGFTLIPSGVDIFVDDYCIINLTDLGLSTITDTAILAKLLPYVDGTKAVGKMGLKVVGENLCPTNPVEWELGSFNIATGELLALTTRIRIRNYIKIIGGSAHKIRVKSTHSFILYAYDANHAYLPSDSITSWASSTNYSYTPSSAVRYVKVAVALGIGGSTVLSPSEISNAEFQIQVGAVATPYEPYQEQLTFLPSIGNSLPNGVADSIKTVADWWEHSKRVSTPSSVGSGVAVNTTNYPTAKNAGQWVNELTAGGTEIGVVGTDSTTGAGMLRFELATPIVTKYNIPLPTSGKTIHRFAGEEKISLYGTGVTFTENVLSVLGAVKFVAGVMTDITSLATITTNTVTFSGVSSTDVVYVKVEHSVNRPLGILEHTPAVSNTASRLAAIEAWIAAQGA